METFFISQNFTRVYYKQVRPYCVLVISFGPAFSFRTSFCWCYLGNPKFLSFKLIDFIVVLWNIFRLFAVLLDCKYLKVRRLGCGFNRTRSIQMEQWIHKVNYVKPLLLWALSRFYGCMEIILALSLVLCTASPVYRNLWTLLVLVVVTSWIFCRYFSRCHI